MSNSNGHITLPINIKADLGYVLGTGNGDLGYNIVNGNINKWAKYKPVRLSGVDYSAQIKADKTGWRDTANWWKGNDGKCGIAIGEYTSLGGPFTGGTFFYFLKNEALSWVYNRPRGAANYEWFRAFDFFHYEHNAPVPVGALAATDIWLDSNYAGQFDWDTPAANQYALQLGNFSLNNVAIPGNYYLGILLWKSNGTFYYMTSASKFVDGGSISVPFTAAQSMAGIWNMVPFISSKQYSIGDNAQAGVYASLFGIGNTEVVLHAPGTIIDFDVFAEWNAAETAVNYELIITNHGSSTQNLTGVAVQIKSTTSGSQDPASGQTEATSNIGNVSVPANGSVTRTGSISVTRSSTKIYWVKGYADNFTTAPYNQIEDYPGM
jgi:hypothetical protein